MINKRKLSSLKILDKNINKILIPDEFWKIYSCSHGCVRILTLNLEILRSLEEQCERFEDFDYFTVDSAILGFVISRRYGIIVQRLTGREIVEILPTRRQTRSVLIFGSSARARSSALKRFREIAEGDCEIVGFEEPSECIYSDNIFGKTIGLFAYGYPKQEEKIGQFLDVNLPKDAILIGVGGAVDYFAGIVPRPPAVFTRFGFEWLWRLISQPRVRFKRIAKLIPYALALVLDRSKSNAEVKNVGV